MFYFTSFCHCGIAYGPLLCMCLIILLICYKRNSLPLGLIRAGIPFYKPTYHSKSLHTLLRAYIPIYRPTNPSTSLHTLLRAYFSFYNHTFLYTSLHILVPNSFYIPSDVLNVDQCWCFGSRFAVLQQLKIFNAPLTSAN